jgi:parvulin-like peptidyl-prolyl isomerase
MAVALLATAGLAGCGGTGLVGRPPAATVGGDRITRDQVRELLLAQQHQFQDQQKGSDAARAKAALAELQGTSDGTFSVPSASFVLTQLITLRAYEQDLSAHGITIKASERSKAKSNLTASLNDQTTGTGGAEELKKLDPKLVDFTIEIQAARLAYERLVAKERKPGERDRLLRQLYAQTKGSTPLCLGLIFTPDKGSAQAAKDAVTGGQSFESVAKAQSQDPTTARQGGFAGCATPAQAEQTFASTDFTKVHKGDLLGPIAVNGQGYVVLEIIATDGPTFEQIKPQLETQLQQQGADQAAAAARGNATLAKAKITVDPLYGTWDPKTGQVVPPAGGATTTAVPTVSVPGS